jgi:hypothetical protein
MSCRSKSLSKNKFTPEEDAHLKDIIQNCGCRDWNEVASYFPGRNPRQCRERWNNYVNPRVMKVPWTPMEDCLLKQKYAELGPKWHIIAKFFPNRSKNYVKNRWLTMQRHQRKHSQAFTPSVELPVAAMPVSAPSVTLTAVNDEQPAYHTAPFFEDPFCWSLESDHELWSPFEFHSF